MVNMSGLPDQGAQQQFINQLAMTLFSWIKEEPCPWPRSTRVAGHRRGARFCSVRAIGTRQGQPHSPGCAGAKIRPGHCLRDASAQEHRPQHHCELFDSVLRSSEFADSHRDSSKTNSLSADASGKRRRQVAARRVLRIHRGLDRGGEDPNAALPVAPSIESARRGGGPGESRTVASLGLIHEASGAAISLRVSGGSSDARCAKLASCRPPKNAARFASPLGPAASRTPSQRWRKQISNSGWRWPLRIG